MATEFDQITDDVTILIEALLLDWSEFVQATHERQAQIMPDLNETVAIMSALFTRIERLRR